MYDQKEPVGKNSREAMKTGNTKETQMITTRQQAIDTGLSFPDTYQDAPFHDDNWQLIRYRWNEGRRSSGHI